jgi:hypothetical protein
MTKEDEKPTWYWIEKYEEMKDSREMWRAIGLFSMVFLVLCALRACQLG